MYRGRPVESSECQWTKEESTIADNCKGKKAQYRKRRGKGGGLARSACATDEDAHHLLKENAVLALCKQSPFSHEQCLQCV